ncbi:MAG: hypothetical protein K6E41_05910 [Solobacterium sp.]|nr:hypothetical protein [Solobacterium sp.]
MLPPVSQCLLPGNLIDLLNQSHGSVCVILVFQHLPDNALRAFRQRPGFYSPGIAASTGIRNIKYVP